MRFLKTDHILSSFDKTWKAMRGARASNSDVSIKIKNIVDDLFAKLYSSVNERDEYDLLSMIHAKVEGHLKSGDIDGLIIYFKYLSTIFEEPKKVKK
jgi:BMFP domain-containing protein YqiC